MKTVQRPAVMQDHVEVLLLEEEDGSYTAMPECDAEMRAVPGPTVEATQAAVRLQWADPPPIRFPDDFPLMPSEFTALKAEGTSLPKERHFSWWVVDVDGRHRALVAQLNSRFTEVDSDTEEEDSG